MRRRHFPAADLIRAVERILLDRSLITAQDACNRLGLYTPGYLRDVLNILVERGRAQSMLTSDQRPRRIYWPAAAIEAAQ